MELKLLLDNNEIDKAFGDFCLKTIDSLDKEFELKTNPLTQKLAKSELIVNPVRIMRIFIKDIIF